MKDLIYAVEDESSIRELYSVALSGAEFEIKCFKDANEMFAASVERLPDLYILDIMLENMDGYAILEKLKSQPDTEDIPCIVVSAKFEEVSKVIGLNLGADDYIAKPFGVLELIARIKANIRKARKAAKKCCYKDLTVEPQKHQITVEGKALTLTAKEYRLLETLIAAAETVLIRDDIFNLVWGEGFFGETRTLDIHINKLRRRLEEANSSATIGTVRGVGYILK